MPIYSFVCKKCKKEFSEFAHIDERDKILKNPCPNCKKKDGIERLISLTAPPIVH